MIELKEFEGITCKTYFEGIEFSKDWGAQISEDSVTIYIANSEIENTEVVRKICEGNFDKAIEKNITKPNIEITIEFDILHQIFNFKNKNSITQNLFDNGTLTIKLIEHTSAELHFHTGTPDFLIQIWTSKWSINSCFDEFEKISSLDSRIRVEKRDEVAFNDYGIFILFNCQITDRIIDKIQEGYNILTEIGNKTEKILKQDIWREDFSQNEQKYSQELLLPLFRKMGYIDVVYNHGTKEYGKDFTFSEIDKFGRMINIGVQVKAGNVSGKVNSAIDELIGQIEDAFCMPYYAMTSKETRYINSFLIIISGLFTDNAKDKIIEKINNKFGRVMGAVYFFDRDKVIELAHKYL